MKKIIYFSIIVSLAILCGGGCKFDHKKKVEPSSPDQVPFKELVWDRGGINGANAQLTTAIVGNLKLTKDKLTYSWVENNLSVWGYSNTQADGRTCVFYKKDGKWHGGFFEWVSTSRLNRDFKNIKTHYKGWTWEEIPNGAEAAFVIISKDGKKRTNTLKGTWVK